MIGWFRKTGTNRFRITLQDKCFLRRDLFHRIEKSIISPVDGSIEYAGTVTDKDKYMVKGVTYSIEELLGSKEYAKVFNGGEVMVLYLSPANYHRIHSPVTGIVGRQWVFGRSS